jgi:hypothetical protein
MHESSHAELVNRESPENPDSLALKRDTDWVLADCALVFAELGAATDALAGRGSNSFTVVASVVAFSGGRPASGLSTKPESLCLDAARPIGLESDPCSRL